MLPKTIRKDMATVEFSIPTEDFLLRLFGSPMLYLHGIRSQKTWKKIQKKIHYALNKAIENNVQSDAFHHTSIKRYLDSMGRDCNSKDNTDIQMILSLTGIVLELLGHVPNYSSRRALNRNDDYYLSGLRTLKYCQTPHQKMRTIIEAAHYKPIIRVTICMMFMLRNTMGIRRASWNGTKSNTLRSTVRYSRYEVL